MKQKMQRFEIILSDAAKSKWSFQRLITELNARARTSFHHQGNLRQFLPNEVLALPRVHMPHGHEEEGSALYKELRSRITGDFAGVFIDQERVHHPIQVAVQHAIHVADG